MDRYFLKLTHKVRFHEDKKNNSVIFSQCSVRFETAPCRLRKWLSDAYSLRSGAVTNRTYRVGAKRLQTAPTVLELSGYKPHLPC